MLEELIFLPYENGELHTSPLKECKDGGVPILDLLRVPSVAGKDCQLMCMRKVTPFLTPAA